MHAVGSAVLYGNGYLKGAALETLVCIRTDFILLEDKINASDKYKGHQQDHTTDTDGGVRSVITFLQKSTEFDIGIAQVGTIQQVIQGYGHIERYDRHLVPAKGNTDERDTMHHTLHETVVQERHTVLQVLEHW